MTLRALDVAPSPALERAGLRFGARATHSSRTMMLAELRGLLDAVPVAGTIVVGPLNLGGSMNLIQNPVEMVEITVDKQATTILMPVTARRALNELPDEVWTKVNIEFYGDPAEGVFKALLD